MATCRDCKLFDLEEAKDKAGRVRSDKPALCRWESKEQYPYAVYGSWYKRPKASYVTAKDGTGCPCFQKRETK